MAAPKYLRSDPTTGTPTEQAAVTTATADSIVTTDGTGRIATAQMPVGITPPTASVVSSENLAAGDLVNVYDNAGTANVRKADASAANGSKRASGFVLSAVTSPAAATVYFPGDEDTAASGLTTGPQFLSAATPGKSTSTPPAGSGNLVQPVGTAVGATTLVFVPTTGYILA